MTRGGPGDAPGRGSGGPGSAVGRAPSPGGPDRAVTGSPEPHRTPRSGGVVSADERAGRALMAAFAVGLAVSITLAQTALALLALRLLWRLVGGRARLAGWPLAAPVVAWVAASLLAALFSPDPLGAAATALRGLALVAALYVTLDALPDTAAADRWLGLLLALVTVSAVVGVLQVALCPWLAPRAGTLGAIPLAGRALAKCHRAHGFYSIYMTLAGVLSLAMLASLPRLLPGGGGAPAWRAAAWVASGAGLAMTYVRGAWIGFAAGVVTLLALVRRGRLPLVVAVVALAVAVLLVPGVRRRAGSIVDPADPTARERLAMWQSAAAIARDHPLTGVGPGQVKRVYPRYALPEFRERPRAHVHNTPLQILIERGLMGLGAWLALHAAFFVRAMQALRSLAAGAARERAIVLGAVAAIAGYLVGGLTEYNFGDSEVVLVAWTVMALPFVVARSGRRDAIPGSPS